MKHISRTGEVEYTEDSGTQFEEGMNNAGRAVSFRVVVFLFVLVVILFGIIAGVRG